jgi:hypothetical protein
MLDRDRTRGRAKRQAILGAWALGLSQVRPAKHPRVGSAFHEELRVGRQFYDLQRSRNKSHHAAIRSLAFKWLRILYRCWKNREPYNEARYEESLRKHAPKAAETAKKATLELQWKNCGGFSKLV